MKIVNDFPPNFEAICEAFPAVRDNINIVFTWGSTIYVPNGSKRLPKHLEVHENYHCQRQIEVGGPEKWWEQYLKDPVFRADEELGAYRRQYKRFRKTGSRAATSMFLNYIAGDLSSGMYGNIYTLDTAKKAITER